jgi:hypothetical protein
MKIDMSPAAVSARLEQVESLRRLCLSLARTAEAREIVARHPENEKVRRTVAALGRSSGSGL